MIKKILTLFTTAFMFINSVAADQNETSVEVNEYSPESEKWNPKKERQCKFIQDCNFPNGVCIHGECVCTTCHTGDDCTMTLIPATVALLLTMSFGLCGIDHCLLSGCTCPGVCFGIMKGLTVGGFLIWYLVDVVFMINGEYNERYSEVDYREICDLN